MLAYLIRILLPNIILLLPSYSYGQCPVVAAKVPESLLPQTLDRVMTAWLPEQCKLLQHQQHDQSHQRQDQPPPKVLNPPFSTASLILRLCPF